MLGIQSEDLLKLAVAIVVGGLVGAEREFRDKAAGFRTMIFISLGAALFTILSVRLGEGESPSRVAANIVTGIGFLGAGAILREGNRVAGLTTAATIWLTSALGMSAGMGAYGLTAAGTAGTLLVLWVFPWIEHRIDDARESRTYHLDVALDPGQTERLAATFRECGLKVTRHRTGKDADKMVYAWEARGPIKAHERLTAALVADGEIRKFWF